MTRRKPIPETVLAKAVVDWLGAEGWEVYPEIETVQGGPRADIVATKGETIWAIEVKRSLTFELLGQADRWKSYAHRVSVAVPNSLRHARENGAKRHGEAVAKRAMRAEGIGLIRLDFSYPEAMEVSRFGGIEPEDREDPPNLQRLQETLTPHHKGFAQAGNAQGRRLTKFGLTAMRVREFVQARPGATIKEVVDGIEDHHYASDPGAVQGIRSAAKDKLIEGVRLDARERPHRLYPAEATGTGQESMVSAG